MNKESSIKQLKRIKQDMTHADDVNALGFAIRFMENELPEIEDIGAAIEQKESEEDPMQLSIDMGI